MQDVKSYFRSVRLFEVAMMWLCCLAPRTEITLIGLGLVSEDLRANTHRTCQSESSMADLGFTSFAHFPINVYKPCEGRRGPKTNPGSQQVSVGYITLDMACPSQG